MNQELGHGVVGAGDQPVGTAPTETARATTLLEIIAYVQEREQNIRRYSQKLRESIEKLFDQLNKLDFSVNVDGEVFYKRQLDCCLEEYFIATWDGRLVICRHYYGIEEEIAIHDVPRAALKQLIKSQAITNFLMKYSKILQAKEVEYAEVATIAEALASLYLVER